MTDYQELNRTRDQQDAATICRLLGVNTVVRGGVVSLNAAALIVALERLAALGERIGAK